MIGLGGLGHVGIKFARALGAHVVAFTSSPAKAEDALALGAHEVVNPATSSRWRRRRTVSTSCSTRCRPPTRCGRTILALKLDGTLCSLGLPDQFDGLSPFDLASGRRSIASSGPGGTIETREMLAFCAEHAITADVEIVKPDEINTALDRLEAGDVKYRLVIDMAG